jgi:hypothetical protein
MLSYKRLSKIETDVVEDDAGERLAHEALGTRLRLDMNSASSLPVQRKVKAAVYLLLRLSPRQVKKRRRDLVGDGRPLRQAE